MTGQRRSRGFTLIELLVVIAIIAILIAIIMPAVQQAREAARRSQCKNNLKQIGIALHNYHDTHKTFPPGWIAVDSFAHSAHEGGSGIGWAAMILPFMDEGPLYGRFDPAFTVADPQNQEFRSSIQIPYKCPSDTQVDYWDIEEEGSPGTVLATLPTANYIGVFGTEELDGCENAPGTDPVLPNGQCWGDGPLYHNSRVRFRDVVDGTSNSFFVGERRSDRELGWYSTWVGMVPEGEEAFQRVLGSADHVPNDPAAHFDDFSSPHEAGAQFLFGDGHVVFITENVDQTVYQSLATIDGGEDVPDF